jgi:hypothetical protein
VSELPALETALLDAARRRYGRAWWRSAVPRAVRRTTAGVALAATAVVLVVVAVTLLRGSDPVGTDERPATQPPQTWVTTVNDQRGFKVSVPPGWQLSAETLTPRLTEPREVLSAGTFPLRFRESSCNHVPSGALAAMGPRDGFVTVQERGRDPGSSWSEFPPRPKRFADQATPERGDVAGCLNGGPSLVEFWVPFSDADRHFYALVVVGADAPPEVRAQAFEILDRLKFDPAVQPDWRASD